MSDKITFSEPGYPVGTQDPIYTFPDNIVSVEGVIENDAAQPASPVIEGNASATGPIYMQFANPVQFASLDVGYFDNLGSTEIIFLGSDGKILSDSRNQSLGVLHFSYLATGSVYISAIAIIPVGPDASGFSADTVIFSSTGSLFTLQADQVDFNNLNGAQQIDVQNGSSIYLGLGANDTVALPSKANFNESVGGGKFLGWTNTSASTFYTDSEPGDVYSVSGTDGDYYISAGQGTDNITISGSGHSHIAASTGAGTENIVIRGGGTVEVTGTFNGSATIGAKSILEVHRPGSDTITFDPVPKVASGVGSGGTLIIDGNTMPTGVINGLRAGDTIDLADVSFSGGGAVGLTSANALQVYEGGKYYNLQLGGTAQDYSSVSIRLSSDGHSGTNIQLVFGLTINVLFDSSVFPTGGVGGAPAGYTSAFTSAVQYFENAFTNPVTINIDAAWAVLANDTRDAIANTDWAESLSTFGSAGSPGVYGPAVTYAQLTSALTSVGAAGSSQLPASAPSGLTMRMAPGEEIALGLATNNGAIIDGDVGFGAVTVANGGTAWSFSQGAALSGGMIDFIGTAEHEVSELLGRVSRLKITSSYAPMDLFRYSSSGLHDYTAVAPLGSAYFSIDGGATSLGKWNIGAKGDLGDWLNGSGASPFDAYNWQGAWDQLGTLGAGDVTLLSALG